MTTDQVEQPNDKHSSDESVYDIITYIGEVNRTGYDLLCDNVREFKTPDATRAYFIPITFGGDPNAGYRIARALGHIYHDEVIALVPDACKSAGTLMCIGMNELVICDRGELGPLDIQLSKKDELFELTSGLDIVQAINFLQNSSQEIFRDMLIDLKINGGLGTKLAAELASDITTGLISPIASQIDPIKLGEHQRAMNIATAYGRRLNQKFKNTSDSQILRLLSDYPAHGFVIDRKEAGELFSRVRAPEPAEERIAEGTLSVALQNGFHPGSRQPAVTVASLPKMLGYLDDMISEQQNNEGLGNGITPTDVEPGSSAAESDSKPDEGCERAPGADKKGSARNTEATEAPPEAE
ncbi:hypothetical protein [Microbulbifer sp.]|uniref:hypothetical protein n=1 Tax=Microbulbifer sp. TaxID=1908541 RepID=UPI00258BE07C|nr:hypothetical protein [Microbulbifer sp.]